MAKSFKEQKEARKLARKAKQEAWAAHNTKHRPLPADQRTKMPKLSMDELVRITTVKPCPSCGVEHAEVRTCGEAKES